MITKLPEGADILRGLFISDKNPLSKMLRKSSLKMDEEKSCVIFWKWYFEKLVNKNECSQPEKWNMKALKCIIRNQINKTRHLY